MVLLAAVLAILVLFVLIVGPWPVRPSRRVSGRPYYRRDERAIATAAAGLPAGAGGFTAGWAERPLELPAGTPLAGYGDRGGRPAEGTADPLFVKALAAGDSAAAVVIVGSDLLVVPPNVAAAVRATAARRLGIAPGAILFSASHTHSGPGGSTRGLLARLFAGRFDPHIERCVVEAMGDAIAEAWRSREPASVASASIDAGPWIENRTRETSPVDGLLHVLAVRKDRGPSLLVVRFSAHGTVLGADNMRFSGDFPGFLQRALERATGGEAMYLGGATGSMGPRVSSAAAAVDGGGGRSVAGDYERARAMGESLAALVLEHRGSAIVQEKPVVAGIGVPITVPPLQLRIAPSLRLSPLFLRIAGVGRRAWLSVARIGSTAYVGFPGDLSGEIAAGLEREASPGGLQVVPLSFNGAYLGYISPDVYYGELRQGSGIGAFRLAYETGVMSWCGPGQEAFFTSLAAEAVRAVDGRTGPE